MHDKILLITAACYLVAVILLYIAIAERSSRKRTIAAGIILVGLILHTWAQGHHWMIPTSPSVSVLNVLSLCALVTVAIPLFSFPFRNCLFDASLVALPLSPVLAAWLLDLATEAGYVHMQMSAPPWLFGLVIGGALVLMPLGALPAWRSSRALPPARVMRILSHD